AQYDARRHGVTIQCYGLNNLTHKTAAIEPRRGAYINQTWQQIMEKQMGRIGRKLQMVGSGADAKRPFPNVQLNPGETIFDLGDRLPRLPPNTMMEGKDGGLQDFSGLCPA